MTPVGSQITFEFFQSEPDPVPEPEVQTPVETPEPTPPAKSTRGRKSLKEYELAADVPQVPSDEELYKKQYYPIGEVAQMFGCNTSLIRYWENEFDILEPRKNRKGDRLFKPDDIKNLLLIHDLLRRRKFTIEGAKDYIKKNSRSKEQYELIQSLQRIKSFLHQVKASL